MTITNNPAINYAIWDFNGVLFTIDGFWDYLKKADEALYQAWKIDAVGKPELKAKYKSTMVAVFEDATDRGLYPMEVVDGASESLSKSEGLGRQNMIFSTMRSDFITGKLCEHNLENKIQRIVTLDDVLKFSASPSLVKESPKTYESLSRLLRSEADCTIETYVDDSNERVMAAVEANLILASSGMPIFRKLYHFSPNQNPAGVMGYMRINRLQLVE